MTLSWLSLGLLDFLSSVSRRLCWSMSDCCYFANRNLLESRKISLPSRSLSMHGRSFCFVDYVDITLIWSRPFVYLWLFHKHLIAYIECVLFCVFVFGILFYRFFKLPANAGHETRRKRKKNSKNRQK